LPSNDCSYERATKWGLTAPVGWGSSVYSKKRAGEVAHLESLYQYVNVRSAKGRLQIVRSARQDGTTAVFNALAERWRNETAHLSALPQILMHPAYQQIIAMGDAVVPLILQWMRNRPGYWFWALEMITRENPVPAADAGNIRRMKQAWLNWGEQRGLI
jgi:hypothetical protein